MSRLRFQDKPDRVPGGNNAEGHTIGHQVVTAVPTANRNQLLETTAFEWSLFTHFNNLNLQYTCLAGYLSGNEFDIHKD